MLICIFVFFILAIQIFKTEEDCPPISLTKKKTVQSLRIVTKICRLPEYSTQKMAVIVACSTPHRKIDNTSPVYKY